MTGGAGSGATAAGGGGSTSVTIGTHTLTAAGGAGGAAGITDYGSGLGQSPGTRSWNGQLYTGGNQKRLL